MSDPVTLIVGAVAGAAAGWLLAPFTRRQLAASVARSAADGTSEGTGAGVAGVAGVARPSVAAAVGTTGPGTGQATSRLGGGLDDDPRAGAPGADPSADGPVRITHRERVVLAVVSGLLPAYVLGRVGWSSVALPPLLLLVGLVQLAYCDLARRLLPKAMVHALTAVVVAGGIVVAGAGSEWERLVVATVSAVAFFTLLFVINLFNPDWLAFGDVRLSFVVGFGLAWVSPVALLEAFLVANVAAAVVGFFLIAAHRAGRRSAVPFGLYLAAGTAFVLLTWS